MADSKKLESGHHLTSVPAPALSRNFPVVKWAIWLLLFTTAALTSAAPRMALAVLFPEIQRELGLSLVQVGIIWAAEMLTGIVSSVLGGSLSDRYGARSSLVVACLMAGLLNTARGFSPNFAVLLMTSLLVGPFVALIPINLHKAGAQVFPRNQLAIANGGVSLGMAFGFALGAFTAATYIAPALGGWGNVLKVSGLASIFLSLVWGFIPKRTGIANINRAAVQLGLKDSLLYVLGIRDVRLICLAVFGYGACVEGLLGYMPLFLRQVGWLESRADLALTTFHIASLLATIPITLLSDRWGRRQPFLLLGTSLLAISTALVPWMPVSGVFLVMLLGGLMRDAFMSVYITRLMESEGIGPQYAGGALGLAMTGMRIGGAIAPPGGNALAAIGSRAPFLFWALFSVISFLVFAQVRDVQGLRKRAE